MFRSTVCKPTEAMYQGIFMKINSLFFSYLGQCSTKTVQNIVKVVFMKIVRYICDDNNCRFILDVIAMNLPRIWFLVVVKNGECFLLDEVAQLSWYINTYCKKKEQLANGLFQI